MSIAVPKPNEFRWRDPVALALFLATLVVYYFSCKGEGAVYNYHVLLADAFSHGRLDFSQNYPWMEIVSFQGRFYTVFPPGPALLILPVVWIFGTGFFQPLVSIFLGAVNVALCYQTIMLLTRGQKRAALWTALVYAFGSIQWYHAEVGSGWYVSHIVAMFFVWLALIVSLRTRNFFWGGLFLGAAYLARLPTIMSVFFVAVYFFEDFIEFKERRLRIHFKNGFLLAAGLAPALLINLGYNYFRWGVPYDLGYDLLPIHDEPWYQYGLFHWKYIPIHLKEMFLSIPTITSNPPYVKPSMFALSILLVMPVLVLIVRAQFRERAYFAAAVTTLLLALPSLAHGGNGFTQFGYRHTLDYFPFLLILIAGGIQRTPAWITYPLVALSILANAWGVVMITHLNLWDMSMRTVLDLF